VALSPSTAYTATISWNSPNSPFVAEFETGVYGTPVDDETSLIGRTYLVDLASADFVEPPGVGPILQEQLDREELLFSVTAESDFAANELHILGGYNDWEGEVTQDLCAETFSFTAGLDDVVGTADDMPATWNNPEIALVLTELTMNLRGYETVVQDLRITGTYHPSLSSSQGGTFSGRIDTRPFAPALVGPEGGEGTMCDGLQGMSIKCVECGGDNPGVFCLNVAAENVRSREQPGLTLQPRSCTDIIDSASICPDEAAEYDEDGDGVYEQCPGSSPAPGGAP